MERILVGVDGSKESQAALHYAESIARATKHDLVIANAVDTNAAQSMPETAALAELELQQQRLHAARVVKDAAASISPGVRVQTSVVEGDAARGLARLADGPEVQMVVVGHRHRGAVARALMGSVADRLVQISPKPVLVVR